MAMLNNQRVVVVRFVLFLSIKFGLTDLHRWFELRYCTGFVSKGKPFFWVTMTHYGKSPFLMGFHGIIWWFHRILWWFNGIWPFLPLRLPPLFLLKSSLSQSLVGGFNPATAVHNKTTWWSPLRSIQGVQPRLKLACCSNRSEVAMFPDPGSFGVAHSYFTRVNHDLEDESPIGLIPQVACPLVH